MGCDIHAFVEFKACPDSKRWASFNGEMSSRNYSVFEAMAGVRGAEEEAIVPPRGMPENVGYDALGSYTLWITEGPPPNQECVSKAQAAKWVEGGSSEPWYDEGIAPGEHLRITHPDWHTPSWLSAEEMREVAKRVPTPWTKAISAMMDSLATDYQGGVRIVFYFDN